MINNIITHFLHPQALFLLILIPVYILYFSLWKKGDGFSVSTFADLEAARKKSLTRFLPYVRHVLSLILIILFSLTLAHPQNTNQTKQVTKKGIDIVIALDVSESMQAEDLLPNRIEAAKKVLKKFIGTRKTDRVGIVIFSGVPFTQSPLTFDYDILKYFVDNISIDSIDQGSFGIKGTAIGDAILAGINRLKNSKDREKIIILLSDGDANTGIDPKIAAYKAKEYGIKIYTIGIGKKGGAPIPVTNALGKKDYARNMDGSVYMATFNEDSLRQISEITNGKFFRADDTKQFSEALKQIDSLEKKEISISTKIKYSDAFMNWLYSLVIVFILFSLFETYYFLIR